MFEATINHSASQASGAAPTSDSSGCLVRIYPSEGAGGMWCLDADEYTIGRVAECDIQLDDASVSRCHAKINKTSAGFHLSDVGSTNGTWVNEQRIDEQLLGAGDRIRVGNQIVKFLSSDDIEVQFHETIYKMTTTDGLTGAYNRQYMNETLEREIARSLRRNSPLSFLLIDIDFFKKINDTFGHLAGDQVLQEFSRRIRTSIEADDVFARYGGEEFALVLADQSSHDAQVKAEQIRTLIETTPFATDSLQIPVTCSIGVASLSDQNDEATASGLIDSADQNLYRAKREGRNRVCC